MDWALETFQSGPRKMECYGKQPLKKFRNQMGLSLLSKNGRTRKAKEPLRADQTLFYFVYIVNLPNSACIVSHKLVRVGVGCV